MKIIKQKVEIVDLGAEKGIDILKKLERAGKTCYKSEANITEESCKTFLEMIIRKGHESVLEHHNITLRFITDRGVTHQIVRHRAGCSYSQESTRYCNYKDKDIEFILPIGLDVGDTTDQTIINKRMSLINAWMEAEKTYNDMLSYGATPQATLLLRVQRLRTLKCM